MASQMDLKSTTRTDHQCRGDPYRSMMTIRHCPTRHLQVHGTCYPLGTRTWSRLAPGSMSTTSSLVASTCTRSNLKPRSKIRAQVGLQSAMSSPSPIQHHRNFQIEVFTFKALFPYYEQRPHLQWHAMQANSVQANQLLRLACAYTSKMHGGNLEHDQEQLSNCSA